ncbi:MAG: T9SS type A sorting domain-containing protein [Melioribacter sp.]|nr:T9SS type A sorting domain-containing protein [Melioribacter sp.]
MQTRKLILLIELIAVLDLVGQQKYPQAPEIWSKPQKIDAVYKWAGFVADLTVTADGRKIYFGGGGIVMSELSDTGWTQPKRLGNQININNFVRAPSISPSGKRIFFTWMFGSVWQLYYSDWDETKQDWGEAKYTGKEINESETEGLYSINGCCALNDTTIVFLRGSTAFIAEWVSNQNKWTNVRGFPVTGLYFDGGWGLYVSPSKNKVYNTTPQQDTNILGLPVYKEDLDVHYKNPSYPSGYSIPFILNISYQADTLYFNGEYQDRFQAYPALTADGKTLFFVANYHGHRTVYVSHMLIDENGIPVSVAHNQPLITSSFKLYPPYPNPFNSMTTIDFELDRECRVSIIIYDTLGQKVKELFSGIKRAGLHSLVFDATFLTSGVYLVALDTPLGYTVKKVTYLK